MGLFTVPVTLSHPIDSEQRIVLDLIVDTGAVYKMLPAEVVGRLGLETPRERRVVLATGEQVTYRVGIVNLELHGEEWPTLFLEGAARLSGSPRRVHAQGIRPGPRSGEQAARSCREPARVSGRFRR